MFSCEFCEIFKITFFTEYLRATAIGRRNALKCFDTPYLYKITKAKSLSESMIKFLENSHTKNQKLLIEAVTKMDGCFALRHYKAEEPKNIEICTLISLKV